MSPGPPSRYALCIVGCTLSSPHLHNPQKYTTQKHTSTSPPSPANHIIDTSARNTHHLFPRPYAVPFATSLLTTSPRILQSAADPAFTPALALAIPLYDSHSPGSPISTHAIVQLYARTLQVFASYVMGKPHYHHAGSDLHILKPPTVYLSNVTALRKRATGRRRMCWL
ncbi:uncharacterized protein EDB91DRAFT_1245762 [Suillus paluster]|uniref:uncharacterized protein n=1 Tax=Suillus paluster TaxID=48578 RepID=UPI001B87DD9A|nr:uncharacterized protein EDB91DRAFT_1245762 [Suillus paluster]KAG1746567.1 hypothetical protein EDB91DRAFT_1245762 [Suillus paluster]